MKRAPVLFAFAYLLAGCDRPQALSVDALAADPARLHVLTAQCRRGEQDGALCAHVAQADLRRFLSGQAGPDEYQTLAELPPIPASFDGPDASMEQRP
ncbi:EexN family lipoprotein [Rudaea sp.]|uniref:EexN family lipoprotein n=1 Tax=Rudaea sp. TaxID=2136325 RepID=UPI003784F0D1